ncbi:hypothetical protein MRB53_002265 [Persea americana]|uniref:Uncharacterized protein n=1 Tax=Persea americana TaxID=3435 RepID=A0ACC2MTW7_PERAE|nr:hypothetical protein MRB53_002265 [Persea americana]
MISYPELPTLRTTGFTKWFIESFSVYWWLSKKVLDVKQSSGKGLGKSDGICQEEGLAFLSGDKHRTGFLEDQDVIRSGAAQEISNERRHENSLDLEIPSTIAEEASGDDAVPPEKRSREEETIDDEDDGLMMPEVPTDEAVRDPIVASEEEPRDFEVDPKSPPADLPEDSDNFEPSMDATFDDASNELMEAESIPLVVEEEQGVPAADPGLGVSSTSFDKAEESPHADIPSPAAPIGKSFLITLPTVPDMGSRPTEHGESSFEPSR